MKRIYIIWLYLATFFIFIISASAANLKPLVTIDACALPKGQVEFRLGGFYSKDRWFPFERRSTDRREAELPSIDLMIGLTDDIEVDLSYSAIYRESERFSWDWDSGDLSIMGKVRIWKETPDIPNISLAVCTKLPNADYNKRFGTDEFDFFSLLLLSKYAQIIMASKRYYLTALILISVIFSVSILPALVDNLLIRPDDSVSASENV